MPRRARQNRKAIPLAEVERKSLGFEIAFDPEAVKDLKKLDRPIQDSITHRRVPEAAPGNLGNPCGIGEALAGAKLGNYWKYRVGDWRIVCDIQDRRIVVRVLRIGNRREVSL